MTDQGNRYEYDVAISFLGGDLGLAEELAILLRDRMTVFLFTERQGDVAGSDGLDTLSLVFGEQARLVVVLYRPGWGETPWTRVEETAIKNRGWETGLDFLLVIPLEEAEWSVPAWVPKTQMWLSYARYGLPTAVPILERKLEEAGGQAKPVTAVSHAQEYARRVARKEESKRRRSSQSGVDAAKVHLAQLFTELDQAVSDPNANDLAFKQPRENAARIWSSSPDRQGTTVTLYWSQSWANTLDQSGLRVRLWRGFAPAAGEDIIAFDKAEELEHHEFDFEWGESRRWVWSHRDTHRPYDTTQLAAFCVRLLINHINGQ